jgi:hypothetical protein
MKSAVNTLDPLNLVHKGGSVLSNMFTPWKSPSTPSPDATAAADQSAVAAPSATAPVGQFDQAAMNAQQNFTQQGMRQKSFSKTIFAGDTGGYRPGGPVAGRPGI